VIFALASVTVAVLTAIGIFAFFFMNREGERKTIEIPMLEGRRFDGIENFDDIKIESEPIFSDDVPEGIVISQIPYGGAKRKIAEDEKYTVKLTVSLGKERSAVPELKNYKYASAAAALRTVGAKIRIVSVYDDKIESDLVLRTSPVAGESIERGDTVTIFVSRNHRNKPVRVKDFVGMSLEEASSEILADGLLLGEIKGESVTHCPKGEVTWQSIEPESLVLYGSRIDIAVSEGDNKEELHPFRGQITEKRRNKWN
jgi:serine/threonine-protein kinase